MLMVAWTLGTYARVQAIVDGPPEGVPLGAAHQWYASRRVRRGVNEGSLSLENGALVVYYAPVFHSSGW